MVHVKHQSVNRNPTLSILRGGSYVLYKNLEENKNNIWTMMSIMRIDAQSSRLLHLKSYFSFYQLLAVMYKALYKLFNLAGLSWNDYIGDIYS